MQPDVTRVCAPARLHLGFLDLNGGLGRRFGGIGMAVSQPSTRLTLSLAARDTVEGPESARAAVHLDAIRKALGITRCHRLLIEEAIPAHAGLGSGTQLALAVAAAMRGLHGLGPDPRHDAERLGRGDRSGIGAGFFLDGGVLVDGGKGERPSPPPVIARLRFPEAWRVILVLDTQAEGIHGAQEREAFDALPPFPAETAAAICRQVLMAALPALAEEDLPRFGAAIHEIQMRVGEHFAPAQGGVFASRSVARAMEHLKAAGAHGTGQSSWGPTGFAFAENEAEARRLAASIREQGLGGGLDIRIVKGRNDGATVSAGRRFADAS